MKIFKKLLLWGCLLFCFSSVQGQDIGLLFGSSVERGDLMRTYHWRLSYFEPLPHHFMWSFSWYNEGHIQNHHRDGMLVQLWYRFPLIEDRMYFAVGAGPFYFFDTTKDGPAPYQNIHGFALGLTAGISYAITPSWLAKLSLTSMHADKDNIDTAALLVGLTYQLKKEDDKKFWTPQSDVYGQDELILYLGQTIVNSFKSQTRVARMLTYRRTLFRYLDASVGWLNEGDPSVLRRDGLVVQVWPTRRFFDGKLALSVGLGAYFALNKEYDSPEVSDHQVAGIITMSASYRLGFAPISLHAVWNRVVTSYNQDTDVIMGGIGYYFDLF